MPVVVDIPIVFGTKPYSGADDKKLPSNVRKLSPKRRRQWVSTFNNILKQSDDESKAFRIANGIVK